MYLLAAERAEAAALPLNLQPQPTVAAPQLHNERRRRVAAMQEVLPEAWLRILEMAERVGDFAEANAMIADVVVADAASVGVVLEPWHVHRGFVLPIAEPH